MERDKWLGQWLLTHWQLGNITVPHQGFGLVLHASVDFLDISCDGLFVSCPGQIMCLHLALTLASYCTVQVTDTASLDAGAGLSFYIQSANHTGVFQHAGRWRAGPAAFCHVP